MKIAITPEGFDDLRKKLSALPAGCQSDVYGDGFITAARKSAAKSRRLVLPRGKGAPLTRKGKPRRHLADSIRAVRVSWRWGGEKVPRSAALVLAQQPHAHLIEKGTTRWKKGPRPFLSPPLKDSTSLMEGFRVGCGRSFGRLVKRLESGKLKARERKAFR